MKVYVPTTFVLYINQDIISLFCYLLLVMVSLLFLTRGLSTKEDNEKKSNVRKGVKSNA